MAVAFIMDFPGGSAEDYDAVMEKMQLGDHLPAGALFHAAGKSASGWQVCDVWDSAEAFQQFADAKIGPITSAQGMSPPEIRSFPVDQIRRGDAGAVTFLQIVQIPGTDAEGFAAMDAAILGEGRKAPEGCVFHVNGQLGDAWCVLDYWTSKDVRDAFMEHNVRPAMEAGGMTAPPAIEELAIHNALTERAEHPAGV
jgi:hypothetical protein